MIECLGEAFALVRKGGVDPHAYLEILTNTLFSAPAYKTYGTIIADQRYEPAGFEMSLGPQGHSPCRCGRQLTCDAHMPVASLVHDHFLSGVAQGRCEVLRPRWRVSPPRTRALFAARRLAFLIRCGMSTAPPIVPELDVRRSRPIGQLLCRRSWLQCPY